MIQATLLRAAVLGSVVVCASGGCEEEAAPPVQPAPTITAPAPTAMPAPVETPVQPPVLSPGTATPKPAAPEGSINILGVTIPVPEGWEEMAPANPIQNASLRVPGEPEPGLVSFSVVGGDVKANMDRWAGQFTGGGQPQFAERQIAGVTVHTAEIDGNYSNMGAPAKENYALRGAVIPLAGGQSLFIKFTGPRQIVEGHTERFYSMLDSVRLPGQ